MSITNEICKTIKTKHFVLELAPFVNGQHLEYKHLLESNELIEIINKFVNDIDRLANDKIPQIQNSTSNIFQQRKVIQDMAEIPFQQAKVSEKLKITNFNTSKIISQPTGSMKPPYIPVKNEDSVAVKIKPVFKIPNFKVNHEKKQRIEIEPSGSAHIVEIRFSEPIGLTYNSDDGVIEGIPNKAGEFIMHIKWKDENQHTFTDNINFSVIDDPKNLWKNIDTDKNDFYFKSDKESLCIEDEQKIICTGSIRGRSHAHIGSFRDDDFYIYTNEKSNWSILIVADGAGSAKFSRKGSHLACSEAGELIKKAVEDNYDSITEKIVEYDAEENKRKLKEDFYYILGNAFKKGVDAINKIASETNNASKDFSTTLLVSVCFQFNKKLFIASAMIGDGAIGVYFKDKNKILLQGNPDSGEFAGQTRFLDSSVISSGFWDRVNVEIFDSPTALLLMTDGISDPIFETENGLKDIDKWDRLWKDIESILMSNDKDKGDQLNEWMGFFSPGHHDDRTLAIYGLK